MPPECRQSISLLQPRSQNLTCWKERKSEPKYLTPRATVPNGMRRLYKQLEASRANGKKSAGPVTPEGKARSARNGTRHGLTSKVVLLACEDPAEYDRLLAAYREFWQPATQPESDLVDDYVAARWRLNRTLALEAASIDLEMDRRRNADREKYTRIDEPTRCALAVHALIDTESKNSHGRTHNCLIPIN